MSNDRGVAHVLGVILMAGFAITVAATVAVAGASMFADSQSQIETSQVESSFSSLAADASELEDGESVEFDLGTADGQLEVRESGELKIYHEGTDGTTDVYTEENGDPVTINSLVYENEDGNTVAYQAGGVFRQHGSGSSLVSAPDFYYRDNALSFPIQKVDGDISSSGTLSGELELQREDRHYPVYDNDDKSNPLSGGTVYVEMESEYCQAWEDYFSQQTRGSISEWCADDKDDNDDFDTVEGQVQVELSVPFEIENEYTHAIRAGSFDANSESQEPDGEDFEEGNTNVDSADTLISNKASEGDVTERRSNDNWDELEDIDSAGTYYLEEIDDDHTFETGTWDDDVEIYVDGDVIVQGEGLKVEDENSGNNVTFYIDGNFDMGQKADESSVVGNSDKPEQTQIFVDSSGYVIDEHGEGGNPQGQVYALIYAPGSDGLLRAGGNFDFEGSLIVNNLDIGSGGLEDSIEHSEAASEFSFVEEGAGPEFYYLHVTERTVTASG
ncbi:DUF7289 family protein [Natranaeroarchaeum sulfidigenes]|uniref:Putative pilin/flagellin n=1 Tax=Natranaeroarchaeum sulfidigenes TaxID=2784880 RepID=A0A897MKK1_9EURY|nr:hypothetical protein [Natranaeroarchaeum sulfidigenes]QSG02650.1 putative pilin/flagellin [Natranaeroarchaeum sulfidigenes]